MASEFEHLRVKIVANDLGITEEAAQELIERDIPQAPLQSTHAPSLEEQLAEIIRSKPTMLPIVEYDSTQYANYGQQLEDSLIPMLTKEPSTLPLYHHDWFDQQKRMIELREITVTTIEYAPTTLQLIQVKTVLKAAYQPGLNTAYLQLSSANAPYNSETKSAGEFSPMLDAAIRISPTSNGTPTILVQGTCRDPLPDSLYHDSREYALGRAVRTVRALGNAQN